MSKSREKTEEELRLFNLRIGRKTEELYNEVKSTLKSLVVSEYSYNKAIKKLDRAYENALSSTDFQKYFTEQTIAVIADVSYNEAVLSKVASSKSEYSRKIPKISLFDDEITLSERIRLNYDEIVTSQKAVLDEALKKGQGIVKTARQINELGGFDPEIPKYIRDLERFKIGGKKIPEANLRAVRKQIEKIKTPGLKRNYAKLVKAIELDDNIDKAVSDALKSETKSFADRLATTESFNTQGHVKIARHAPDPKTQWAKSKPKGPNICNFCLSMEAMEWIPIESFPKFNYHPYCKCNIRFKRSATKKADLWTQEEYEKRLENNIKKIGVTYVKPTKLRNLRENTIIDKLKKVK